MTADISKTRKTVRSDLAFIFDLLSELITGFVSLLVSLAVENVVSFTLNGFSRKRGCVTMRNYAETCTGNAGYNFVYNFFYIAFAINKLSFCSALFKRIFPVKESFPKGSSLCENVALHAILHLREFFVPEKLPSCLCQFSAIMVYFRRYVSSRPRGFLLISFWFDFHFIWFRFKKMKQNKKDKTKWKWK